MNSRTAFRAAWGQQVFAVSLVALSIVLIGDGHLGWRHIADAVVFLLFTTVGLLVAIRQPRNVVGWLLCGTGDIGLVGDVSEQYARFGLAAHPGKLPGTDLMAWLAGWTPPVGVALMVAAVLLFPDGRLPSRQWRFTAWLGLCAAIALTLTLGGAPTPDPARFPKAALPFGMTGMRFPLFHWVGTIAFLVGLGCVVAYIAAVMVRLRHATGDERAQIKWVTFASALVGAGFVVSGLLSLLAGVDISWSIVIIGALPVAIGVAMFKYRLYDIDVVISKTLVYGLLATFIAVTYAGVVVGVGAAIGARARPPIALSIASTAFAAVVFQPVRARLERTANRLVYGPHHTPYEVLAAFSERIGQGLTEDLPSDVAAMVAEGTGASDASVWLVIRGELRPVASWPARALPKGPIPLLDGFLPTVPGASRTIPVRHRGQLLGAIAVTSRTSGPLTPSETKLLADLAAQAGVAFRNMQLIAELKAARHRIITAQDAERRRLERDIHDGAQQRLVTLALAIRMARIRPDLAHEVGPLLDTAAGQLSAAVAELRDLARGIYPPVLAEEGLGTALQTVAERAAIPTRVAGVPAGRLPASVEATAYLFVTSALADAAEMGASSLTVQAEHTRERLTVEVTPAEPAAGSNSREGPGFPVLSDLADRVAALDGWLEFAPRQEGYGAVRLVIPCESLEPAMVR
jgi:signal transduction histidine kinase